MISTCATQACSPDASVILHHRHNPSRAALDNYCSLCDLYFPTNDLLRQHVDETRDVHPRCETCNKGFLNMNALRCHYDLSNRHHFCAHDHCWKHFETTAGLRVHLEHAPKHNRRRLPPLPHYVQIHGYIDGWEDAVAKELERESMRQGEAGFVDDLLGGLDSTVKPKSRVEVTKAILAMKTRRANGSQPSKKLKQKCAICLSTPKTVKATRCGHLFCESCITHIFENSEGCPSCRTAGTVSQLRMVNLTTA
ncbi:hypothetical protein D9758_007356 [Tetrapyrgos nigripes]|uniref:RING-type domain-containing protein n=1 Tax=Tetrapyrgos nigripes TaxID=182062 RepID=A0A8H5LLJ9_9AGAR|nr:hypothetical protein D9758_007356 [Tetrapyrgos nigripes]